MPIIQEEKFKRKDHKKTKDNITVDVGSFRKDLTAAMLLLQQSKPSTTVQSWHDGTSGGDCPGGADIAAGKNSRKSSLAARKSPLICLYA